MVDCPVDLRRVRAIGRGVDAEDFDRRAANQPGDEYLRAHATTIIDNAGGPSDLSEQIDAWWGAREANGWKGACDGE